MGDAQTQLDTRAIEISQKALTQIEFHEKACDERMAEIRQGIAGIHTKIGELHQRVDEVNSTRLKIAGAIIMVLMTALGIALSKLLGLT